MKNKGPNIVGGLGPLALAHHQITRDLFVAYIQDGGHLFD